MHNTDQAERRWPCAVHACSWGQVQYVCLVTRIIKIVITFNEIPRMTPPPRACVCVQIQTQRRETERQCVCVCVCDQLTEYLSECTCV